MENALQAWIAQVFDHPVTDPEWYQAPDARASFFGEEEWHEEPEVVVAHIAETFERSGELLACFSDAQLDQGFWYLFGNARPDFMGMLLDPEIPLALRVRALRSFVPLFEQVMAARCSSRLSYLELVENPLNSSCYMWFDELLDRFNPQELVRAQLETELILALRRILAIPHDACRESALHGIGHWVRVYPQLAETVDEFLLGAHVGAHGLRPELIACAERSRTGDIL